MNTTIVLVFVVPIVNPRNGGFGILFSDTSYG
jgi:hypothetical protein